MFSLDVKSCHISCIKYHKTSLLSQYSWVVVSLLLSICTITYSCSIFADKIHIFDNVPQNIVICDQSYNEIGSCHGERLEWLLRPSSKILFENISYIVSQKVRINKKEARKLLIMLSPLFLNIERLIVVVLTAVAFLLALVSFRGKSNKSIT